MIQQETMDIIEKKIKEHYGEDWDTLIKNACFSSTYEKILKKPISANDFAIFDSTYNFIVIPYNADGKIVATINLELIKSIEYQQAEAKVYRKIDIAKPAYFIYGHENSLPVLFEWK